MTSLSAAALILGSASSFVGCIVAGRSLLKGVRQRAESDARMRTRVEDLERRVDKIENR